MSSGLATALAIILAAISAPFIKVYDVITGADAKEKANVERREAIYNSLYEPMIKELKKRDPIKDAQEVFKTDVLYLPTSKNIKSYSGFWQLDVTVAEDNNERLGKNEYIQKYAFALYGVDEKKVGENIIHNLEYEDLSLTYKKTFNVTMLNLSKKKR
jgi:hypothetical protein